MAQTIDQLLAPHLDRLRNWCRRRCRDAHEADDIVQDVVLRALQRQEAIREPDAIGAYLYRCAQRRIVDYARRRVEVRASLDERPAPTPRDDRGLEQRRLELRAAIRTLPSILRRPVRLHYLRGHTLREVASRLDTTVPCVKTRLYRARRQLREETACRR